MATNSTNALFHELLKATELKDKRALLLVELDGLAPLEKLCLQLMAFLLNDCNFEGCKRVFLHSEKYTREYLKREGEYLKREVGDAATGLALTREILNRLVNMINAMRSFSNDIEIPVLDSKVRSLNNPFFNVMSRLLDWFYQVWLECYCKKIALCYTDIKLESILRGLGGTIVISVPNSSTATDIPATIIPKDIPSLEKYLLRIGWSLDHNDGLAFPKQSLDHVFTDQNAPLDPLVRFDELTRFAIHTSL